PVVGASASATAATVNASAATCAAVGTPAVSVAPSGRGGVTVTGQGFASETKHILSNSEAGAIFLGQSLDSGGSWSADIPLPSIFRIPVSGAVTGASTVTVPLSDGSYQFTVIGETCGDGVSLDVSVAGGAVQQAQSAASNAT